MSCLRREWGPAETHAHPHLLRPASLCQSTTVLQRPAAQTGNAQPCLRQLAAPDRLPGPRLPVPPSPLGLPAGADNASDSREEKLLMCFCLKLFLQLYTKVASIEAVAPLDFLWDASWRPFCGTGGLGSLVGGETKFILSPRPQLSAALGPGVPDPVSSWPWPHRATACSEAKQCVL